VEVNMSEYEDLCGRPDVADSYSMGERLMRTRAGDALRSHTLADARKGAVGYFTVTVEIDKDHFLEFDGERWELLVDTRGEYDYDGDGYGTEGVDYVYERWSIEEPPLDLPVHGGSRGEDVIWFKADGWSQDVLKRISFDKEAGICPRCWEQIGDLPRQCIYSKPPAGGITDEMHAEYHRAGQWYQVLNGDREVIREVCDRAGCEACPEPYRPYVDPNDQFVGRWRRCMSGGYAYVFAVVRVPQGGKWQSDSTVTVEMDWQGPGRFKVRTHSTPLRGGEFLDHEVDTAPTKEQVIAALGAVTGPGHYEQRDRQIAEILRRA
jgi:hypothetical protein